MFFGDPRKSIWIPVRQYRDVSNVRGLETQHVVDYACVQNVPEERNRVFRVLVNWYL
jgi:hypothetical protein